MLKPKNIGIMAYCKG